MRGQYGDGAEARQCLRGRGVYSGAPGHWDSNTLTTGLRLRGASAVMPFPGATNTAMLEDYVAEVLVPELRPGDVVIRDNLQPHKSQPSVEVAGASVAPPPAWGLDLAPIEEMVSRV